MALMDMKTDSSAFPSSSSAARWKYDVFLSFRGEDTRNNFMGHLYEALIQKGIVTFKDDEKLERGKSISPELLKAIEESEFAIVILSKNYASSTWCLDELAKIIRCKNEIGMIVLPVFHYVEPSNVRKQMGTFEQAFVKHEEKENKEMVEKWRDALTQVGNLRGWHLKDHRSEIEDIKDIVGWISLHLKYDALPDINKDLVGIYSRMMELEELESCLALRSNDVCFIGIWGMGGIGKTTLARVVYYMASKKFEACSFIKDVRENVGKHGLVPLQQKIVDEILMETNLKIKEEYDGVQEMKKRLCHKRILLVLDDINELDQLKMLAGEHDWFGPGSKIIITTRDAHVLKAHGVDGIYEVKGLNNKDALQLFSSKAFKEKHVPIGYFGLTNQFLNYAKCLPLALQVLGSFLFGKSIVEWEIALQRLKKFPEEAILQVLEISLNGLQKSQKEIFLYIACFFNHQRKDYVVETLDILGLFPGVGLRELVDKSLLKMDDYIVSMHDLLEEMGRNIVCQEYPSDPGKRSKLWHYEDIDKVFKKNKGTEEVQAMDIWGRNKEKMACWNPKAFLKMCNIKFLRIKGINLVPAHLPDDLKVLEWIQCPLKSLPSSYELDELIQLLLQDSKIEELWIGRKNFDKLKFIDLTNSSNMIITPNFIGVPNLEKLILKGCTNLCELHPSIGVLKKIVLLNLEYCGKLSSLPSKFEMDSLKTLILSYCSILEKIPEFVGNMACLQNLFLDCTAIRELPSSIGGLIGLTSLTLSNCKNLVCLPSTICSLKSLESLDLSRCSTFNDLPKNLGNVEGLKKLNLSGTAIKELPLSIDCLTNLTSLTLCYCKKLVCLPNTISDFKFRGSLDLSQCHKFKKFPENLWIIEGIHMLDLSGTAIEALPSSIERLTSLVVLTLQDCSNLVCLPSTICSLKSLEYLDLSMCSNFDNLPHNLGNLEGLRKLSLIGTAIKELPSSIERLTALTSFTLLHCEKLVCLPNTTRGFQLRGALDLSTCVRFKNLPESLWMIRGLEILILSRTSIEEIPSSIEQFTNLTLLNLRYCINLVHLPNTICSLKLLNSLDLFGCLKFANLPENIGNMKGLEVLNLCWTAIKEVPSSIILLKNLKQLHIRGWKLSQFFSWSASIESMNPIWITYFSLPTSLAQDALLLPSFLFDSLSTSPVLVGLLLPSLSGLQSLTYLYLSDCDLSSIPNDIGCLSSLEHLDLSRNNFDSLPESMSQLYNLRRLYLEGCKRLQSLENVPSTVHSIIASNCTLLERLLELQLYPFTSDHCGLNFQCLNYFKLVDNIQSGNNMLQLQVQSGKLPDKLEIIIPGREIPKWFSHECTGHILNIQVPSCGCDDLMEIALCAVVSPNIWVQYPLDCQISCSFNGINMEHQVHFGIIESHHLWLLCYSNYPQRIFSPIDVNGFCQLEIEIDCWGLVVEKIGVCLLYKQDMEDPDQTMAQCSNNCRLLYEGLDVLQHDLDDSAAESIRKKRNCDDNDGDEPSGECYNIEEPQPKRIQMLE